MPSVGNPGSLTFAGLLRRVLSHLAKRLPGWRLQVRSSEQVVAVDFADASAVDIDAGEARLRRPGREAVSFLNGYDPVFNAPLPSADTQIGLRVSMVPDGAGLDIPVEDEAGQSDPDNQSPGF